MNFIPILNLVAVVFDITLLTLFLNIFFQRKELPKPILTLLYGAIIVFYYCSSAFLVESYQKSIIYFVICLFLSVAYRGKIVNKCVLILAYVSIGIMLETIMSFVLTIFDVQLQLVVRGTTTHYLIGLASSATLFFLVIVYFLRPLRKNILEKILFQQTIASSLSALFLTLLFITIILSYAIEYLTIMRGMENGIIYFLLLECLILAFDVVIFVIFIKMVELQQKTMYTALIKQQSQAQEVFYQQSTHKNTQLITIIHDEKNFLLGVIGALQEGQTDYAIIEMQKKVEQLVSNITTYTGLLPLDNLLTVKVQDAAQYGIQLHPATALYGTLAIDPLDLVVLLGNALDNAINAASQVTQSTDKKILFNMKLQEDELLLDIRNPVKEKVLIEDHKTVIANKQDGLHGFGLANIEHIVRKYYGGLWLDCTDTTFTLKLYLENEHVEKEDG